MTVRDWSIFWWAKMILAFTSRSNSESTYVSNSRSEKNLGPKPGDRLEISILT